MENEIQKAPTDLIAKAIETNYQPTMEAVEKFNKLIKNQKNK